MQTINIFLFKNFIVCCRATSFTLILISYLLTKNITLNEEQIDNSIELIYESAQDYPERPLVYYFIEVRRSTGLRLPENVIVYIIYTTYLLFHDINPNDPTLLTLKNLYENEFVFDPIKKEFVYKIPITLVQTATLDVDDTPPIMREVRSFLNPTTEIINRTIINNVLAEPLANINNNSTLTNTNSSLSDTSSCSSSSDTSSNTSSENSEQDEEEVYQNPYLKYLLMFVSAGIVFNTVYSKLVF